MSLFLGIDPGLTGAMTLLDSERGILEIRDIPTCPNGTSSGSMRSWVDVGQMAHLLTEWSLRHSIAREHVTAAIERPIPMPRLPVQTIAAQFDTFGVLRAAVEQWANETVFVNPQAWKKMFGVHKDKEAARACVQRLYPDAAPHFARKKDHNRAESALIAHFVLRSRA